MLHDAIEDSELSLNDLVQYGFSERVVNALKHLTRKDEDSYELYIEQVSKCNDAIIVKLCDLEHNMELVRIQSIGPNDIARINKYRKAFSYLSKRLKS